MEYVQYDKIYICMISCNRHLENAVSRQCRINLEILLPPGMESFPSAKRV